MYDNQTTKFNADTSPDVWGFVEITANIPLGTPEELTYTVNLRVLELLVKGSRIPQFRF